MVLGLLGHVRPSNFFRRILRNEALVYKSYFFQNSRSTEIIQDSHTITDTQSLTVLGCLPTRQDGIENRDKVYSKISFLF